MRTILGLVVLPLCVPGIGADIATLPRVLLQNLIGRGQEGITRVAAIPGQCSVLVCGERVLVASIPGLVVLDELPSATIAAHEYVSDLAVSPCGQFVAAIRGQAAEVWGTMGTAYTRLAEVRGGPTSICFSHDESLLAIGNATGRVRLCSLASPQLDVIDLFDGEGFVTAMSFDERDSLLAVAEYAGRVRIIDVDTGLVVSETKGLAGVNLCRLRSETLVVGSGFGSGCSLWNWRTWRQVDCGATGTSVLVSVYGHDEQDVAIEYNSSRHEISVVDFLAQESRVIHAPPVIDACFSREAGHVVVVDVGGVSCIPVPIEPSTSK